MLYTNALEATKSGEKEMEEQCVQIKDLSSGNQESVPFDSIISYIQGLK